MSPAPSLRSLIEAKADLIGAMINIPHPATVEIFGRAGFDFLIVDAEHSAVNRETMVDLIRAGDAVGIPILIRIPSRSAIDWIEAALDGGAAGIIVPRLETAEQLASVLSAAKYPPQGNRGSGPSRATRYGLDIAGQLESANRETVFAIMLETAQAVDDIAGIAAIPGLDMVLIGPNDLALSIEHSGSTHSLTSASAQVTSACLEQGVVCGSFVLALEDLPAHRAAGMTAFITGSDLFALSRAAHEAVARSRR